MFDLQTLKFSPQKIIDFYNENGYVVVEGVVDDKNCDKILNIFQKHAKENGNNDLLEMTRIHASVPETLELMKNENAVLIVEKLLGSSCVGLQTVCVFKKAGTPSAKHAWNPHQDASYCLIDKDDYVGGDVALDDHLPGTGCLYVYPGSHKEKVLPYQPNKSFDIPEGSNPGNRVLEIPKKYKKIDLHMKKGSFFCFHGHVIHGSYENISVDGWRPALLMAYSKKEAKYPPGKGNPRAPIELK